MAMATLMEEGGVTEVSLANARYLIAERGLPDFVELYWTDEDWHCVEARWEGGRQHVFTGFGWGYPGEGPRGLKTFFQWLGLWPAVSLRTISSWPQRLPALTFVRGEDYAAQLLTEGRTMADRTEQERVVAQHLGDTGYTDAQIERGLAYAREQGASGYDETAQCAISRILYTDEQLAVGERFGWEPHGVDWSLYRSDTS